MIGFSVLCALRRAKLRLIQQSVVCFGILRPLRPLREAIKIRAIFFARRGRKERRVLFPFVYHACAEGVANFVTTRVRKASAHHKISKAAIPFNPLI